MSDAYSSAAVDKAIGERIRRRRVELGMTQDQLADQIGLSYQQVQKYERGSNRISAAKLYELVLVLAVDPGFFFERLETGAANNLHGGHDRPAIDVARAYGDIHDRELRSAIAGLVRALAERSP
ncbi:MAG: helix-turn-helix transcriptional regulator [Pseudomonadota bacterium]